MERMAREIREMKYDMVTGTLSLTTMGSAQLSFLKTGLSGTNSDVSFQYFQAPQRTLTMAYATAAPIGSPVLVQDVSAFSFTYLQGDGVTLATAPGDVRSVRIALTVSPVGAQPLSLVSQVHLRNL
jgi:hypothetical protein